MPAQPQNRSTVRLPTCNSSSASGMTSSCLLSVIREVPGVCAVGPQASEESVTLRDETVSVRPVTQGEAGVPSGAFEERTVEVHQTAEEPVVSKTARVAEEVVVHKEVTERTETVRDPLAGL